MPFAAGGMIILAIICLGVAAVAIFGSGDLFGGILAGDTATPTRAATLANTATASYTIKGLEYAAEYHHGEHGSQAFAAIDEQHRHDEEQPEGPAEHGHLLGAGGLEAEAE